MSGILYIQSVNIRIKYSLEPWDNNPVYFAIMSGGL